MKTYRVIIPWFGVKKGQLIKREKLHRALKPNVELVENVAEDEQEPEQSGGESGGELDLTDKEAVKAKLKELNIDFHGNASLEKLVSLLPTE